MPQTKYFWAVQTIDPTRGEVDWQTLPPVRTAYVDTADPGTAARDIYQQRQLGFLSSVRGRVAVWVQPGDWPALRTIEPSGIYEEG